MSKKIIGLTGGLGSGKSTAADYFANLGITVIDCDKIAREIVKPKTTALKAIVKKFGENILQPDGSLNRQKLHKIIFSDPLSRKWIEDSLHPPIIKKIIKQAKEAKTPYVILVIPLLFEAELEHLVDRILVIDAPKAFQIKRIQQRNHLPSKDIQAIIQTQVPRKKRLIKANDIINNTSTKLALKKQVEKLHKFYLNL